MGEEGQSGKLVGDKYKTRDRIRVAVLSDSCLRETRNIETTIMVGIINGDPTVSHFSY